MNVYFDNVNMGANSGASTFAKSLKESMESMGVPVVSSLSEADISLAFSRHNQKEIPFVQRLDGIYFNPEVNYKKANVSLKKTYDLARSVIFQSEYNKMFVNNTFGAKEKQYIVQNGSNIDKILDISPIKGFDGDIWSCCSYWEKRPNKRLKENIEYFKEFSNKDDKLIICGNVSTINDDRIICLGDVGWETAISVYKRSKYFIHLSWFDSCPNVVVDAKNCGCIIICTSLGGTWEIAGEDSIVIKDMDWDYKTPVNYKKVHPLDFSKKVKSKKDKNLNIDYVAKKYIEILQEAVK
jgi:glycosyltransferase involved in cell wall biosynthesis